LIRQSGHSAARRGGSAIRLGQGWPRIYHETTCKTKDIKTVTKPRKIEITIQTDQRLVIYATGLGRTWCKKCAAETEVVTLQAASLLASATLGDLIDGLLPSGLHLSPSSDGSPRICLDSLLQLVSRGTKATGTSQVKGLLPEK
jgi:hypothetical protein